MDAGPGDGLPCDSSPGDGLEKLAAATDVPDLLRKADEITPQEIDLWAALVLGERPEVCVHCTRPPSPTVAMAVAESMMAELCEYEGGGTQATLRADQVRLSCAMVGDSVVTRLTDVYRDHLTQRDDKIVALSRAGATDTAGLTLGRWRQAEEALEVIAWMLGSLVAHEGPPKALTDPLSGAYTRGFFEEVLNNELVRNLRRAAELAVIMLQLRRSSPALADVQPSPALLAFVGARIRQALRVADISARLSLRRFAVLLPDTSPREGLIAANRLGAALRRSPELNGWSIDIGITGVGVEIAGPGELLGQAEAAMRAAERKSTAHPFVYM